MRTLNRILQLVVKIIFLMFIIWGLFLALAAVFGAMVGMPEFGLTGVTAMLGVSVVTFVALFVVMLFAFGLFSTLLEIAENTRVLRDAVESGSIKVVMTNTKEKLIDSAIKDNDLTLEDALRPIRD
jgi:ABC-type multidrug transport system fused ATPase/permease subunit